MKIRRIVIYQAFITEYKYVRDYHSISTESYVCYDQPMPKTLEECLNAYPELKKQILTLLELSESGIERADKLEERTVDPIRSLGQQVIKDSAESSRSETNQMLYSI